MVISWVQSAKSLGSQRWVLVLVTAEAHGGHSLNLDNMNEQYIYVKFLASTLAGKHCLKTKQELGTLLNPYRISATELGCFPGTSIM